MIAVVLGTLASMALVRYEFFGRDAVSLLVLLPIALPGIVTGIALNTLFTQALGGLTFFTLVVGHATFCIVIVVNNASARLRRMSSTVEEASMDLGATPWTTWRLVTFPALRGALLAGALLAFALSLRRDHRDHLHRRPRPADPAAVDLPEPVPAQPVARSSTWPPSSWC